MEEFVCQICPGKPKTRAVKGKRQRFRHIRDKSYRYVIRECRRCTEWFCFRQLRFRNEKNGEEAWVGTTWVEYECYRDAQEVEGEERIGSTASEFTKEQAKGPDIDEKAIDAYYAETFKVIRGVRG